MRFMMEQVALEASCQTCFENVKSNRFFDEFHSASLPLGIQVGGSIAKMQKVRNARLSYFDVEDAERPGHSRPVQTMRRMHCARPPCVCVGMQAAPSVDVTVFWELSCPICGCFCLGNLYKPNSQDSSSTCSTNLFKRTHLSPGLGEVLPLIEPTHP
uniref:Uncharacterized protein n=1 Tax=Dunaliella tertiolecta TaxID=3047 RepID=A0A7S3R2F7_DUNTE|mmetsp:Transcript_11494/g.31361  ORF Transcript_11494/g.31361 Transcript_11494/m.31361 type:complete len:157 (+) Transcript_11494:817-1287(+)